MGFRSQIQMVARWLGRVALIVAVSASGWPVAVRAAQDAPNVVTMPKRFSVTEHGNMLFVGNTSMTCSESTQPIRTIQQCLDARKGLNTELNDNLYMRHMDQDADGGTFNSTSASLDMPSGASVLFAGLYWGGNTGGYSTSPSPHCFVGADEAQRLSVQFRAPGGGYGGVTGSLVGEENTTGCSRVYAAFANVTSQVRSAGNGEYWVANIQASQGVLTSGPCDGNPSSYCTGQSGGSFAGWSLVVIYGRAIDPLRNMTVWDSVFRVQPNTTGEAHITQLITPLAGPVNARMGALVFEGDLGLINDGLSFQGSPVSDGANPINNVFNGTITQFGSQITRNPSATDIVNTLGVDVDMFDVSGHLANGVASAVITLPTSGDNYFPTAVGVAIDVYEPQLQMTKQARDVNGGLLVPGDVVEYTLLVTNTGNDKATNSRFQDAIPAGTTYLPNSLVIVSQPGGGNGARTDQAGDDSAEFDGGNNRVVYRVGPGANASRGGEIQPGESAAVRFSVTINGGTPDGTYIPNTGYSYFYGSVLTTTYELSATAVVTVLVQQHDLGVLKTDGGISAIPGDTIVYTITAQNVANITPAPNAVLTETLPDYTSFVGPAAWTQVGGGRDYVRQLGTLNPGATVVVTFAVKVDSGVPITLTNIHNVVRIGDDGSNGPDTNPGNNTATEDTPLQLIDLAVQKTDGGITSGPFGTVVYTLTAQNLSGSVPASNVLLTETLPDRTSFAGPVEWAQVNGTRQFVRNVGFLSPGASVVVTFVLKVDGTLPLTYTQLDNQVKVGDDGTHGPDINLGNNTATDNTPLQFADLSLTKSNGSTGVRVGEYTTYTIVAINHGPSAANGARIIDTVGDDIWQATWTCVAGPGAVCLALGGFIGITATDRTFTVPVNMAAGSRVTVTLVALVGLCTDGLLINTARIEPPAGVALGRGSGESTFDVNPANNSASDIDGVGNGPNVLLKVTPNRPYVKPGSHVLFTAVITNYGPDAASYMSVSMYLPPQLLFYDWSASRGSYSPSGGMWSIGPMAVGEGAVLTMDATVAGDAVQGFEILQFAAAIGGVGGNTPQADLARVRVGNGLLFVPHVLG